MRSSCLNAWLIAALRRAKPIIQELGFPAYSAHYSQLTHELTSPIAGNWGYPVEVEQFIAQYCSPNPDPHLVYSLVDDIAAIYEIMHEEVEQMQKEELEKWGYNPKMHELGRLLYGDEEEEEEFWESDLWDDEEEEEDPLEEEEEEDEDWEVEEWEIEEEEEVLAWWCGDPDCKTIIVCTNHSIDCHPEEDP
jgi:hypothetical protein